nr:hypothetical protein [Tanacetum cinerariifolium]
MLWGIITSTNVDYAELLWEEFIQAILTDKVNLGSPTKKGRKDKPHVIPYCRLTKIIICHLGRIHNIHQRSASLFHLAEEDFRLGNLKFVPKGEIDEPKETKERPSKASTAKPTKPEPAKEKSTKITLPKQASKEATRPLPVVEGKGKAIETEEQAAYLLVALHTPKRRKQGKDVDDQVNLEEKTDELDQGQDGSDPGRTPKSRPPPEQVVMDEDQAGSDPRKSHGALAGPNLETTHNEFMAELYPKVQERFKFPADEHVILKEPLSSAGTLSSMKNLDDANTIGNQFINDKSTEDEPDKMADENIPVPAPIRSDDQILLVAAWVPIRKSKFVLDLNKKQKIQSFKSLWIFYRTLTSSEHSLPLPRDALEITPVDQAHQFVSPPSGDAIMDFINQPGYTEIIHFVSRMATQIPSSPDALGPTKKGRKDKPHVIPYCRLTKIIICHLGRIHNIHQRSASLFHLAEEDFRLESCSRKGRKEEDCECQATKSKPAVEKSSKPAPAPKPKETKERPSKASTAKPPKPEPAKEKSTKITLPKQASKGKIVKVCKAKRPFQLVVEPDEEPAYYEPEPELEHQGEGDEDDMERAIQMSLKSFLAQSQAHVGCVAIRELVAEATRPLPVVEGKEQGKDVDDQVNLEEKTDELDQGQDGSDPGRTPRSRPPPEQVVMDEDQAGSDPRKSHGALAGPNPKTTHNEFMAELYPKVQERFKFPADEHVILKEPLSSARTLSSMKNLDDAYTIGNQFINDKSTEDEPGKLNAKSEVVSMVTVLIHQASTSIPPLSTPIIDISPPKPASSTKAPIFTKTTTTTTTNLLFPPPSTITKHAVHIALQTPLRDRFRELPEADMKVNLHQRMFESGSYKSLPEHVALYEALEASIEQEQRDEFLAKNDKSHKRRRDDQDPPPPPPDSDLSKRRRHDTSTSGSS